MIKRLGKKKLQTNENWIKTYNNIYSIISFEEVKKKEVKTLSLMNSVISSYDNVGYFWSAGKDSLVLQSLMEKVRPNTKCAIVDFNHHYPSTIEYINQHKPKNLITLRIDAFSDEFINNHELFYGDNHSIENLRSRKKWKAQKNFAIQNGFDLMVTGRRIIDGNICGNKGVKYLYTKNDYDTFNPIFDWSHEEVLGYLYYNNIELPKCYFHSDGFLIGTVEWVYWSKRGRNENEMLEIVLREEPEALLNARGLNLVDKFLKEKGL